MAALNITTIPATGLRIDNLFVPATLAGDDCPTGEGVTLIVKNTDASSKTVTLVTPGFVDGDLAIADRTFTIPATSGEFAIPVRDVFRDLVTGRASITYSAVTGLTVCVVRR